MKKKTALSVIVTAFAAATLAGGAASAGEPVVTAASTGRTAAAPDTARGKDPGLDRGQALREVRALLAAEGRDRRGRGEERADRPGRFTAEENVFLPSTVAVADLDTDDARATVPLFQGIDPQGGTDEQYIITEASDFTAARQLGVNYAPKLALARGTGGEQEVALERGRIRFRGAVDFSPTLRVVPGVDAGVVPGTGTFPPGEGTAPGAVADAEWSSAVVLPSGLVINAQIVSNSTGEHDRLLDQDLRGRTATLELLDGFQGGDDRYWHFVTDSSDATASALEKAVWAPRLAALGADGRFGRTGLDDDSALLGFSPNINGISDRASAERQGLNHIVDSGGDDPRNVFPLDPDNRQRRGNNYSPMWSAAVNQWTQAVVDAGERRAITGFEDLRGLVDQGLVESGAISPDGPGSEYVAGLRPTGIIINCPVIAQPFEQNEDERDDDPTT